MRELTLLFDFDGTLAFQNRRQAYEWVVDNYADSAPSSLVEDLYTTDISLCARGTYDRTFVFAKFVAQFKNHSAEQLTELFWRQVEITQSLRQDCRSILKRLRSNHEIACVTDTDGPHSNKVRRVRASGIADLLTEIFVGEENVSFPKGSLDYLSHVIDTLSIRPEGCVIIGDKVNADLLPAKALGLSSILIRNPEYPGKWPLAIDELTELPALIQGLRTGAFLCYSHKDSDFVDRLEDAFAGSGTTLWRDIRDLPPGSVLLTSITEAIRLLPVFLVVVSKESAKSPWVRDELEQALHFRQAERKKVIPVVIDDVDDSSLYASLDRLVFVDFRGEFESAATRLRDAVRDQNRNMGS